MKNIFAFITALLIFTTCQAQKEQLVLNLVKGETYRHKLNIDMNIIQSVNGMDMNIRMEMGSKINYKVISVKDSVYEMEINYEGLSIKMDSQMGSQEFNSEKNDPTDAFSKIMNAMKENSFIIKMAKSGQVLEVSNTENLFRVFEKFTELSDTQKAQMKAQLSKSYGEKAFKDNIKMSTMVFPTKPIGKGDRWTVKNSVETGISTGIETTYELAEVTEAYYIINGTSKIASLSKDTYAEQAGMQMRSDLNGAMSTSFKLSRKTGWIIDGKIEQQIKGNTYFKESTAMPNGMTMPMELTNKITISGN